MQNNLEDNLMALLFLLFLLRIKRLILKPHFAQQNISCKGMYVWPV